MKHSSTWFALILIASALLLSAESGVSGSDKKHQNQTTANERRSEYKAKVATPAFTIVVQPAPVQIIQQATPAEQKRPAQKWYQRPTTTDWGILIVTSIYTCISIGLLRATRNQAKAAREALTKLERAWIFVVPKKPILYGPPDQQADSLGMVSLEVEISNSGRSPAWLTGESPKRLRKMTSPLPGTPEYKNDDPHSPIVIAANVSNPPQWLRTTLTQTEFSDFINGILEIYAYGILHYRDVFGDFHDTRYCIKVHAPVFDVPTVGGKTESWAQFAGPDSYNRNT